MATVIAFLIGVVVGGGVMFFVYRNNNKTDCGTGRESQSGEGCRQGVSHAE